jgi:glycosyltransferase involved in cell wall biosynthesis
MPTPVSSLIRQTKSNDKLNILTFCYEEKHEAAICRTGHNFYAITVPGMFYKWNPDIMMKPSNYTLFDIKMEQDLLESLPPHLDFDLILVHERPYQFQIGKNASRILSIPLVAMTDNFPIAIASDFDIHSFADMKAHANIFGNLGLKSFWQIEDSVVIHPGVDTERFTVRNDVIRKKNIMTLVHRFAQRDEETQFSSWRQIIEGFEYTLVGHNPGLPSEFLAYSLLPKRYQESRVYLNTVTGGVFPIEVIEAMASGCVVVTYPYPGITDFVKDGENGFICKDVDTAKRTIRRLIEDDDLANKMSVAARQFAVDNLNIDQYTKELNKVFDKVVKNHKEIGYEDKPTYKW